MEDNREKTAMENDNVISEAQETIRICPKCGAENKCDAKFCNKCGSEFHDGQTEKNRCPRCGEAYESGAKYCLKCGYKFQRHTTRKRVYLILLVFVILLGGFTILNYRHEKEVQAKYEAEQKELREKEEKRQEEIATYQEQAKKLYSDMVDTGGNLDTLSMMYGMAVEKDTDLLGPSFFISYVEGLCAQEISDEKDKRRNIDQEIEGLRKLNCSEPEVENLDKAIDDFYNAYCERYDLLVGEDFSAINFKSKDNTCKDRYVKAKSNACAEINKIENEQSEETKDTEISE